MKARYDVKIKDPDWLNMERRRGRIKYYRKGYKSSQNKAIINRRYQDKYPEKYAAKNAMQRQARNGLHAHHWSYAEQNHKDVFWLNPSFHAFIHRFLEYVQTEKCYKEKATGKLLSTKASHSSFIKSMKPKFQEWRQDLNQALSA